MKKIVWIVSFLILIIAITLITLLFLEKKVSEVCFSNYCFSVEIAQTSKDREQGLTFRKNLDKNNGMLFVFPTEGDYSFWMKNTLIPLDIIWIDQNKEVVFVSKNNQPCEDDLCPLIASNKKAKYVLEINAGLAEEIGISIGDKVELK